MTNDFRYRLETPRLTGRRQQKFTCPQCGRRKCLVRYVDLSNACLYVADTVGKCDHQHSCGYHYRPSEYYRDNQWARRPDGHRQAAPLPSVPPPRPFEPLPMHYVTRSHSPRSDFWQWLTRQAAPRLGIAAERLQQVFDDYLIGATRRGDVIFWQIDPQGLVHGGHVMHYGPDGHREGPQGWTHTTLIRQRLLPQDWALHQCLFGAHLLPRRRDAPVCIVESEKTALVMAALRPAELWLATSGSNGLTPERLHCLQGRRVTVFPDSGCYQKWSRQMQLTTAILYNVSPRLESYPPNTDLCDLLLPGTAADG